MKNIAILLHDILRRLQIQTLVIMLERKKFSSTLVGSSG